MEINLRAFFKEYNPKWKRLTLTFLDDEIEKFTPEFFQKKYNLNIGNPVDFSRGEFYVKVQSIYSVKCYLTKNKNTRIPLEDLINKRVELIVQPRTYHYKGKQGWNLKLIEIYPH